MKSGGCYWPCRALIVVLSRITCDRFQEPAPRLGMCKFFNCCLVFDHPDIRSGSKVNGRRTWDVDGGGSPTKVPQTQNYPSKAAGQEIRIPTAKSLEVLRRQRKLR